MFRPVRDELKFIISFSAREALLERWRKHLVRDPYTGPDAVTPILSQYYDSPALAFYYEKLNGVGMRSKVRLRTYGNRFVEGRIVFIEIKQRYFDKIRKVRQKIHNFTDKDFDPANWIFDDRKHASAFNNLVEVYQLRPSVGIWYQREAYEGILERDVRVTFDSCLTVLHPRETPSSDIIMSPGRSLLPGSLSVLEVKSTKGIPPWVTEGAMYAELIQRPVPKYVLGVEKLSLDNQITTGVFA